MKPLSALMNGDGSLSPAQHEVKRLHQAKLDEANRVATQQEVGVRRPTVSNAQPSGTQNTGLSPSIGSTPQPVSVNQKQPTDDQLTARKSNNAPVNRANGEKMSTGEKLQYAYDVGSVIIPGSDNVKSLVNFVVSSGKSILISDEKNDPKVVSTTMVKNGLTAVAEVTIWAPIATAEGISKAVSYPLAYALGFAAAAITLNGPVGANMTDTQKTAAVNKIATETAANSYRSVNEIVDKINMPLDVLVGGFAQIHELVMAGKWAQLGNVARQATAPSILDFAPR